MKSFSAFLSLRSYKRMKNSTNHFWYWVLSCEWELSSNYARDSTYPSIFPSGEKLIKKLFLLLVLRCFWHCCGCSTKTERIYRKRGWKKQKCKILRCENWELSKACKHFSERCPQRRWKFARVCPRNSTSKNCSFAISRNHWQQERVQSHLFTHFLAWAGLCVESVGWSSILGRTLQRLWTIEGSMAVAI